MKITVSAAVIAVLLVMSVFSAGFALAEESGRDSTTSSEGSIRTQVDSSKDDSSSDSSEDLVAVEAEAAFDASTYRGLPAVVYKGSGWALGSAEGFLADMHMVQKTFVSKDDSDSERTALRGMLSLGKTRYWFSGEKVVGDSLDVDLYQFTLKSDRRVDVHEKIGTLSLDRTATYTDFSLWTGTLELDGESYKISLALKNTQRGSDKTRTVDVQTGEIMQYPDENRIEGEEDSSGRGGTGGQGAFRRYFNWIFGERTEAESGSN